MSQHYDWRAIERRWLPVWEKLDQFRAGLASGRPRRYILDMFAYPSGDLHMGHAEAFAIGDAAARYATLRGFDVLHPVGWDSFGLPAENAAIKRGTHPAEWTDANIAAQAESFRKYAVSFDWSRRLHTSDPTYYRWTQWLFLRLYENGLAYRKPGRVNWCPRDQTVLANEQVISGRCERCGTPVTKKSLTQWYFRITAYAQRLLDDMEVLEGHWPDPVLAMQRNWIGRSEGAEIEFTIEGRDEPITVFTTRPDTLYGATFVVIAADAVLAAELCSPERRAELDRYLTRVGALSEIERQSVSREKTGVFLGRYAINPASGDRIPIWAADYVLADYGSGAVMAVPAHDQRDLDFARTYGLPVRAVIDTGAPDPATGAAVIGDGPLVNSGPFNGLDNPAGGAAIVDSLRGARPSVRYRLRDWLLSRQRFWGCPIPIVHCAQCGEVPVPDDQLPVRLPDLRGADLAPKGVSPLASAVDWVHVACPRCGGEARRDSDTMDTFVDSSWYFLRFVSPDDDTQPFDPARLRDWLPIDQYVGGAEHSILHLLYSRFFTKALHDLGLVDISEPFRAVLNQGQVLLDGKDMSKSSGNLVDLGVELDTFGVDAIRLAMVFAGPPQEDIDWADVAPAGVARFLARVWRLVGEVASTETTDGTGDPAISPAVARAVDEITDLMERHRFNVVVARLMELTSTLRRAAATDPAVREGVQALCIMLSPFAPYCAEECWSLLGHDVPAGDTVSRAEWPLVDESLLVQRSVTCVVQIDGRVRHRVEVPPDITEAELRDRALATVASQLDGRTPGRVIVRAPKLVNIVTAPGR